MYLKQHIIKTDILSKIITIASVVIFTGFLSTTLFYYEAIIAGFGMSFLNAFEAQWFRWGLWIIAILPLMGISKKINFSKENWIKPAIMGFLILVMIITISLALLNIFLFRIQGIGITASQFFGNLRVLFVSEFFFLMITNIIIWFIFTRLHPKSNSHTKSSNHEESKRKVLEVKRGLISKSILIETIQNISGYDYYVKIHTDSETYILRKSLKMLEEELAESYFFRVHRSSLINLSKVDQIILGKSPYVKLSHGERISISRRRVKLVLQKFKEYKDSINQI